MPPSTIKAEVAVGVAKNFVLEPHKKENAAMSIASACADIADAIRNINRLQNELALCISKLASGYEAVGKMGFDRKILRSVIYSVHPTEITTLSGHDLLERYRREREVRTRANRGDLL